MLLLSHGAVIRTRETDKKKTNKDYRHACIMQVFAEGGDPSNSYTKPNVHKDRLLLLLAVTSLMACRCVCVCVSVCVCACVLGGGFSFALECKSQLPVVTYVFIELFITDLDMSVCWSRLFLSLCAFSTAAPLTTPLLSTFLVYFVSLSLSGNASLTPCFLQPGCRN